MIKDVPGLLGAYPGAEKAALIIDVDGTICASSDTNVTEETSATLARLQKQHRVYLLSNNWNPERPRTIANRLAIPLVSSPYRKPDPRLAHFLPKGPLIFIGDKCLTDGLLAYILGSGFIKVDHVRGEQDSLTTRFLYVLDDACWFFIKRIKRAT